MNDFIAAEIDQNLRRVRCITHSHAVMQRYAKLQCLTSYTYGCPTRPIGLRYLNLEPPRIC
jgi:hypothetical protein